VSLHAQAELYRAKGQVRTAINALGKFLEVAAGLPPTPNLTLQCSSVSRLLANLHCSVGSVEAANTVLQQYPQPASAGKAAPSSTSVAASLKAQVGTLLITMTGRLTAAALKTQTATPTTRSLQTIPAASLKTQVSAPLVTMTGRLTPASLKTQTATPLVRSQQSPAAAALKTAVPALGVSRTAQVPPASLKTQTAIPLIRSQQSPVAASLKTQVAAAISRSLQAPAAASLKAQVPALNITMTGRPSAAAAGVT
jgi:hypothetical protein